MRYTALFTLLLAAGCQVTVGGGAGTQTPNNANGQPQPVAQNNGTPATNPPATNPPATNTVDPSPGVRAPRLGQLAGTGGGTSGTPNPNLSPTTGARVPLMTGDNDFGSGTQTPDSFKGDIYFIPPATNAFPDLAKMQPAGVLYSRSFNIAPRNFDKGFPGIDTRFEWFAIRYTGNVTLAAAGDYKFKVLSDDGAVIYIDGKKVLDNDGMHAPKNAESTVNLTAGSHTFQLDYFQGPRYQIALQLWVTPPGGQEKLFASAL